jgi:hypothetical protein
MPTEVGQASDFVWENVYFIKKILSSFKGLLAKNACLILNFTTIFAGSKIISDLLENCGFRPTAITLRLRQLSPSNWHWKCP